MIVVEVEVLEVLTEVLTEEVVEVLKVEVEEGWRRRRRASSRSTILCENGLPVHG